MSSPSLSPQPPPEENLQQQQHQHLQEAQEPLILDEDPQTQIHEIENQPDQGWAPEEAQSEDQENPEAPKVQESFAELHVVLPITDPHMAVSEGSVTTPSHNPQNRRGVNKRKKGKSNVKKQQAIEKKLQALMEKLNPIPSIPPNMLDFSKHEKLLKKLGLWDFFHLEFDRDVRVDLIAQLVATYDPKLRCSYVNEFRIAVNRADMARAFKLPLKKEKGNVSGVESVDLDSELVSEDSKVFIEDFVSKCVLLHEDLWVTPVEVVNWLTMIRKGHPEKVDWATFFWLMMEKELTKGERLGDCYYASHFQYLIKSQREEVLLLREEETAMEKVELNVEVKEEDGVNEEDVKTKEEDGVNEEDMKANEEDGVNEEDVKAKEEEEEDGVNGENVRAMEEKNGVNEEDVTATEEDGVNEENVKAKEEEEDGVNKMDVKAKEEEEDGVNEENVKAKEEEDGVNEENEEEEEEGVNEEDVKVGVEGEGPEVEGNVMDGLNFELTLGQDVVEEEEEVKNAEMIDVDNCKEDAELEEQEEQGRWDLDGKNNMGRHFMGRCSMEEDRGFGSLEDRKEDEGDMEEDEEEGEGEGEEGEEEAEDGLNILSNVNALEGDGLTGNLLQTMEANLMGFGSQGQLRDHAMVDLRVDMRHMDSAAPFFNNNNIGKRVMEHDNDIPHNDSNKRLKINDPWDQKPGDFGTCMAQMQHLMDRARVMYEEKEQAQEHLSLNQQLLLNELQKRDSMIEHLHKTKLDEIQKRDGELYRYERELYLMGGILDGYRKALKETQRAFAEYRQRAQLPEEPLYKDTGPGGLMLSTGEIEKLREKQEEEYRINCSILEQKAKEAEEGYTGQFEAFLEKINMLDKKLTGLETDATELIDCYRKKENLKTEEKVSELLGPLPNE
ncbi:Hypothetical predicted protein [Olea europaea subsp. europaea]|uniref:Uncharacterized protein n=1 Tax=Olea europaea subsp. europaea TaxID=158383 RepID=A0A8S0QLD2_OLEEU|nr:Hypothetical predicted protein [Olea europaea subsp. europaea]